MLINSNQARYFQDDHEKRGHQFPNKDEKWPGLEITLIDKLEQKGTERELTFLIHMTRTLFERTPKIIINNIYMGNFMESQKNFLDS